ncbi:MAG: tyrosine recombinase XerC [Clostridia bacterium]
MKNRLTDTEIPDCVRKFLIYTQTVQNKSEKTTEEYYFDLRLFFRFLVKKRNKTNIPIDEIYIADIDMDFVKTINLDDAYDFLAYLGTERILHHKSKNSKVGLSATSRARKISCLRSFFKFLVDKTQVLEVNPIANLDIPKKSETLPKYLTLDESVKLVNSIDGTYKERDTCIILLFLSCGLRVSELVGINLNDIQDFALRIRGKGNKERIVYLNQPCIDALTEYLKVRQNPNLSDENALFISRQSNRINVQTVKWIVKKHVGQSGLNRDDISAHKLRHTAATLMYSNGVDIRTLQEVLGHKNLDTTMIYTHIDNSNLRSASQINPISQVKISK